MSQTDELKDVPSPQAALMQMAQGFWAAKALQAAAQLEIADLLEEKPKTAQELSKASGVDSNSLYRLLRALASRGIFKEISNDRFENTPLSEAIRTNVPGSVRDYAIFAPHDGNVWAWTKFMDVVRTGKSSFTDVNGCGYWEYFQKHPEISERYNKAMTAKTSQVISALLKSYDFSQFKSLIDVGGGLGTILVSILNSNPQMRGCLYDQSSVIHAAKSFLEAQGVINLCKLISGDFFESVPEGYDAYLMKNVLHDWEDKQALTILKNCHASIPKHGKLLILEAVLGKDNTCHPGKWMDLHMMVAEGGRERTEQEFRNLLQASDFELKKVIALPAAVAVIEAEPT